jgi:PhzF family phenazine biosynthesis protein
MVNVGPSWIVADLGDAAAVRNHVCDAQAMIAAVQAESATGITIFGRGEGDDGSVIAVRSLFPVGAMLVEDPVCGSGNGAVAAYRRSIGELGAGMHYMASQGREIGRDGKILVSYVDNTIHIGGKCVALVRGNIAL